MNPVCMLLDSRQELLCLLDHDLHRVLYKWCSPELGTAAKVTWRQSQQTVPQISITWEYCPRSVSSVAQSCPTLCNPMDCSTPGLPFHCQLPELALTHIHWVGDAIQPSHPLLSPSPLAFNLSQHQGLFKWAISSHQVGKIFEFQLQHQSFQWTPRTDLL